MGKKQLAHLFFLLPALIFAVLKFLPRIKMPGFRYTGDDPAMAVWNFGWPLAIAIYDPRNGFHVGPLTLLVVPVELMVLLTAFFLMRLISD